MAKNYCLKSALEAEKEGLFFESKIVRDPVTRRNKSWLFCWGSLDCVNSIERKNLPVSGWVKHGHRSYCPDCLEKFADEHFIREALGKGKVYRKRNIDCCRCSRCRCTGGVQ